MNVICGKTVTIFTDDDCRASSQGYEKYKYSGALFYPADTRTQPASCLVEHDSTFHPHWQHFNTRETLVAMHSAYALCTCPEIDFFHMKFISLQIHTKRTFLIQGEILTCVKAIETRSQFAHFYTNTG